MGQYVGTNGYSAEKIRPLSARSVEAENIINLQRRGDMAEPTRVTIDCDKLLGWLDDHKVIEDSTGKEKITGVILSNFDQIEITIEEEW